MLSEGGHGRAVIEPEEAVVSSQEIQLLAYWLWQRRGSPSGSPDRDWFMAEALLRRQYKRLERVPATPLFACGLEKRTR